MLNLDTEKKMTELFTVKLINSALVNWKFQLDVESFGLKFQFQFRVSNENTNFPMNLQNSSLGISALLRMSGTQKGL